MHVAAGYTVLGLIVFRIFWGFIGTRYARFSSFLVRPAVVMGYVRDLVLLRARRYLGHNPAGGAMIVLLLLALLGTTISGLAVYGADQHAGPLAFWLSGIREVWEKGLEEWHEFFANFTVFLVAVHLLGVLVESLLHKENLVGAMFTGSGELRIKHARRGARPLSHCDPRADFRERHRGAGDVLNCHLNGLADSLDLPQVRAKDRCSSRPRLWY